MSDTLRIRMYNVGFGDCFLLTLPGPLTLLVDAGFHAAGKGMFTAKGLVEQVISDVREVHHRPRIDVVIATHRHADHIYAFNAAEWDQVEVGEVWMPWVEDRKNPEARKLWKGQHKFATSLAAARKSMRLSDDELKDVEFILWNAGLDIPGMALEGAAASWSNARALECLHEGFARRDLDAPRFLPDADCPETFTTEVLPGVKVHVLGPMRDPDLIEELDPSSDDETYRALRLVAGDATQELVAPPFSEDWHVDESAAGGELAPEDVERLEALARGVNPVFAAEKVDGMVNSTSLVLVLQVGKARLLLPGDAEWGTWKQILANEKSLRHLKGATFFKVGHHGSHNATAKTLVERVLPRNIPAMISTQEGPGNYRKNIPLADLLGALHEHGIEYVRSDKAEEPPEGFSAEADAKWIDLEIPC
ncbi:hypothetical protein [Variovorax sp. CY25R-8]|uniref:hypothetical protein n=1 Tax=Variovorax sp. CY25R-8 TaxID=2855501 RepID=UPI0021BACF74|nr:hypothetical protein [Variovorax sp. CY25R-8]MCT8178903.1 hypothetical protein [Variovorax sp. CY25R-8]